MTLSSAGSHHGDGRVGQALEIQGDAADSDRVGIRARHGIKARMELPTQKRIITLHWCTNRLTSRGRS